MIGAFVIGFMKNTNSSPMNKKIHQQIPYSVFEASSTNEEQSLMMMRDLILGMKLKLIIEIDSLSTDSIPQDTGMVSEE